ncbi:hypothetical protein PM082_015865 [Marasmius tenuissimus]|nr:hypothetical protein PM082_015865 [Marasmius tenuissimus]
MNELEDGTSINANAFYLDSIPALADVHDRLIFLGGVSLSLYATWTSTAVVRFLAVAAPSVLSSVSLLVAIPLVSYATYLVLCPHTELASISPPCVISIQSTDLVREHVIHMYICSH